MMHSSPFSSNENIYIFLWSKGSVIFTIIPVYFCSECKTNPKDEIEKRVNELGEKFSIKYTQVNYKKCSEFFALHLVYQYSHIVPLFLAIQRSARFSKFN